MRLAIEGAGYRCASDAFVDGNQAAARVGVDLAGDLAAYAGMAGDDATATDFAASYDDAAAAAVEALAELVAGFASLARLADGSLRNHAAAERASVLTGWAAQVVDPPAGAELCTVVHLPAPASALGSDSSSVPGWATAVLDLLEGVVWPDADTDRLRAAAATWRSAAGSVGALTGPCATALAELSLEVSPEIPLAVATTEDLRSRIESLAEQLTALGAACDEHAAHVDAKRGEMLDLLEQLAWELGIGAVVSGALTLLTGGGAAPAAGAAGAARTAAASARLRGILESLALASRGTAANLRPVGTALRDTRAYLARLSAARVSAISERGSLRMFGHPRPRRWLSAHEKAPGHTLREHVNLSDDQLLKRLAKDPRKMNASTFTSQDRAEKLIDQFLQSERSRLADWLESGKKSIRIEGTLSTVTGRSAFRDGHFEYVSGIRVVLLRDRSMPEGFHILTSFPQP